MENENIYDKIREIFGGIHGNFNILEEQIDLDLQMEYFEYSRNIKDDLDSKDIINSKESIFDHNLPMADKKKLLAQLASVDDVEAFRAIEKYLTAPDYEIREWAILALQESRMLIESKLLDENQVFISTGLGGKGAKLRYFIVLISANGDKFTTVQQKVIRNEFEIALKRSNAEIEKLDFFDNFSTIQAIIPLNIPIKHTFKTAINECNQYGAFLKPNFIITNVKKLSVKEIKEFLKKEQEKKNKD